MLPLKMLWFKPTGGCILTPRATLLGLLDFSLFCAVIDRFYISAEGFLNDMLIFNGLPHIAI